MSEPIDKVLYNKVKKKADEKFQSKTGTGHIIPLHGINLNFSIVFTRADTTV